MNGRMCQPKNITHCRLVKAYKDLHELAIADDGYIRKQSIYTDYSSIHK